MSSILERLQKKSSVCYNPPTEYRLLFERYLNALHVALMFPIDSLYYFAIMSGFHVQEVEETNVKMDLEKLDEKNPCYYDIPSIDLDTYKEKIDSRLETILKGMNIEVNNNSIPFKQLT